MQKHHSGGGLRVCSGGVERRLQMSAVGCGQINVMWLGLCDSHGGRADAKGKQQAIHAGDGTPAGPRAEVGSYRAQPAQGGKLAAGSIAWGIAPRS